MPLPSLDSILSEFRGTIQRALFAQRVLIAVTAKGFTCSWLVQGRWVWEAAVWPEAVCPNGRPEKSEAIADLIAEFLLDAGIIGARVELLLPLELCEWKVVDGLSKANSELTDDVLRHSFSLLFDSCDRYLSFSDCFTSCLAVSVLRADLQAWIDVFAEADLYLDRVDWLLSSAWFALSQCLSCPEDDLAWLISSDHHERLVLLRKGVPEVDRVIIEEDLQLMPTVLEVLEAWRAIEQNEGNVQWQITAPPSSRMHAIVSGQQGIELELFKPSPLVEFAPSRSSTESQLLDPLVSLGFSGLALSQSAK